MDNFNGTPGPWSYEGGNNENCEVQAKDTTIDLTRCDRNTGEHVISREEMDANARLIAASPDLLSALQHLVHLHVCEQEGLSSGQPSPTDWLKAVDHSSEAINKALGKDQ